MWNELKNKMFIIIVAILVLFGLLFFVTNYKNKQTVEDADNPYDKDTLRQETIDLLDDPDYQNIIVPDELDERIESGEPTTVYYFSPTCSYCQKTTPILAPLADDLDVDMVKMNLLEYDKMDYYDVEGTPTLRHYEDGEEVASMVGYHEKEEFEQFFEEYVLD